MNDRVATLQKSDYLEEIWNVAQSRPASLVNLERERNKK